MARGNVYLAIPKSRMDDPVPNRVKDTYGWTDTTTDEQGNVTETFIHPTWQQVAERFKNDFGEAIEVKYQTKDGNTIRVMLMEMDLSFISGEVDDLIKLKRNKPFPRYRLFTRREAKRLIRGVLTEDAETFQ